MSVWGHIFFQSKLQSKQYIIRPIWESGYLLLRQPERDMQQCKTMATLPKIFVYFWKYSYFHKN